MRPQGKVRNAKLKVPNLSPPPTEFASPPPSRSISSSLAGGAALTGSMAGGSPSPAPSASFEALPDNATVFNPDTSGAVGPNHVMTTLASQIRIQNRNGGVISTVTLDSFWSSVGNPEVYDPRLLFDPFQQRWIHVAVANFTVNPGLLLAVSTSADPTGSWHRYFIDIDTSQPIFAESPNVGFNKNWIVIQANMFDKSSLEYTVSEIFTFNKLSIYGGGAGTFTRFTLSDGTFGEESFGGPINAQVPAVTMDDSLETLYLLSHWIGDGGSGEFDNFGFLRVFRIQGSVNSPTFAPGEYATTLDPLPWAPFDLFNLNTLPQLGTTDEISAGDCRLQNVVFRGGSLWTTQTIFLPSDNPTRASVQWWELVPTDVNDYASIFQFGRVDDPTGAKMYAYPSIFPNKDYDAAIGFSEFSATTYPSAAYVFKTDAEPSQFRPSHVYKAGQHSYAVFDGDINRWGDWSATVVDPLNDVEFWTLQEYGAPQVGGGDRWGTWWSRISPPVDLAVTMTDAPDPVASGGNVTYSISITNKHNPPQLAPGIRLTDVLPAGFTFVSATASQGGCSQSGGTVTCDFGTLQPSNRITATLTLNATGSGPVANTVTVTANGPDLNPADNTASTTTTVNPSADISVMAAAAPNPVHQGQNIIYTIAVQNGGPSTASNVRLTNTLPASVTYVSANPSQGSCSRSGQVVTCSFGNMASSASTMVTIVAQAGAGGTINNVARAGSANSDSNAANNTANTSTRVNALPVLGNISNQTINEDASAGPLAFTVSDAETASSSLLLTVSSSDQTLVPNANLVLGGTGSSRTLTAIPLPNRSGSTVITRTLTDNDGVMVSSEFTLTVQAVNDPPTISQLPARSTNEDTGFGPLGFVVGDVETAAGSLTVTRSSSNTSLIPTANIVLGGSGANRTVTVTPAANAFGTATVTLTVSDGSTSTPMAFLVTVQSINDLPTISTITAKTITEDLLSASYGFTISDVEDASGSLTPSASSSNPSLIPPGNVTFSGTGSSRTFRLISAANQFGQCTITITITDSNGGTRQSAFSVTVNPANDPPTLDPILDVTVDEDTGQTTVNLTGIAPGPNNETESVSLSATSSRTSVIPHPTVTYGGSGSQASLVFQTVPDANGSTTVTVTANDGQGANATFSRSFTIHVTAINDPPTMTALADRSILEDASLQFVVVTGLGRGASNESDTLTVSASSSDPAVVTNPTIIYSSPNSFASLRFMPVAQAFGSATITVTVNDGQSANNMTSRTFTVTVQPVNDAPALDAIEDVDLYVGSGATRLDLSGIGMGQPNENQTLTVAATSADTGLLPDPSVTYVSPGATGSLTLTAPDGGTGSTSVTVTVQDDGGTAHGGVNQVARTFAVRVLEPPGLLIQIVGNDVVLSWPSDHENFVLESRGEFDDGAWTPVAQAPQSAGGFFRVTLPASSSTRYFQLRRP